MWDGRRRLYVPTALEVLTLEGEQVKDIVAFVFPPLFARFGLPSELPVAG